MTGLSEVNQKYIQAQTQKQQVQTQQVQNIQPPKTTSADLVQKPDSFCGKKINTKKALTIGASVLAAIGVTLLVLKKTGTLSKLFPKQQLMAIQNRTQKIQNYADSIQEKGAAIRNQAMEEYQEVLEMLKKEQKSGHFSRALAQIDAIETGRYDLDVKPFLIFDAVDKTHYINEVQNGKVVRRTIFDPRTLEIKGIYKGYSTTCDAELAETAYTFANGDLFMWAQGFQEKTVGGMQADEYMTFSKGKPDSYAQGFNMSKKDGSTYPELINFFDGEVYLWAKDYEIHSDQSRKAKEIFEIFNGNGSWKKGFEAFTDKKSAADKCATITKGRICDYRERAIFSNTNDLVSAKTELVFENA